MVQRSTPARSAAVSEEPSAAGATTPSRSRGGAEAPERAGVEALRIVLTSVINAILGPDGKTRWVTRAVWDGGPPAAVFPC